MKLLVVLVLVFGVACQARHIHPVNLDSEEVIYRINADPDVDVAVLDPEDDIQNIKLNRFVPLNSIQFFKSSEPCEDGFKLDVLGICREVWD